MSPWAPGRQTPTIRFRSATRSRQVRKLRHRPRGLLVMGSPGRQGRPLLDSRGRITEASGKCLTDGISDMAERHTHMAPIARASDDVEFFSEVRECARLLHNRRSPRQSDPLSSGLRPGSNEISHFRFLSSRRSSGNRQETMSRRKAKKSENPLTIPNFEKRISASQSSGVRFQYL